MVVQGQLQFLHVPFHVSDGFEPRRVASAQLFKHHRLYLRKVFGMSFEPGNLVLFYHPFIKHGIPVLIRNRLSIGNLADFLFGAIPARVSRGPIPTSVLLWAASAKPMGEFRLGKSFRTHLNKDVARERKVEFAADHVWRLVAPLGEHGLGLRPPCERIKEPFYDEEKSEGRRLFLALVGPKGERLRGVSVWIATTIEGKSFRDLALEMGAANSDREIKRVCRALRQRKHRLKEKILKLLHPGWPPPAAALRPCREIFQTRSFVAKEGRHL